MESPNQHRRSNGRFLPVDLLAEILIRVPAKALFRNKCVSQEWHATISLPSFAATYQSRYPPTFAGFLSDCLEFESELECTDADPNPGPELITFFPRDTQLGVGAPLHLPPINSCCASSNALLLLINHDNVFSVLNPITGASVEIPPLEIQHGVAYGFICALGHNGVASYRVFALSLLASSPTNRVRIAAFSSDTGQWATSNINLPRPVEFKSNGSRAMVASDGFIYLIDDDLMPDEAHSERNAAADRRVVSYDPIGGSTELIELPQWVVDVDDDYDYYFSMREYYDGSLTVCRRIPGYFAVWVLSADRTWTLRHSFVFDFENDVIFQILYFCKDDRAIYLKRNSMIVRCYCEDEQCKFEDVCTYIGRCEPGVHIMPFISSPWPISLPALPL